MNDYVNKNKIGHNHLNKSVLKINDKVLNYNSNRIKLLGVKNTSVLYDTVVFLKQFDIVLHTIDKKSENNRAVDFDLINPITGKYMSGSSSGSAYNVFKDINHLGLGTDGGGSVLGPAINLNLYSFISQKLPVKKINKSSTDGIEFFASAGLISKDINLLCELYNKLYDYKKQSAKLVYLKADGDVDIKLDVDKIITYDKSSTREDLMTLLLGLYDNYIVISFEKEIDCNNYSESILNSFDSKNVNSKGIIRVANMLNCDAFTIPVSNKSSGFVISTNKYQNELVDLVSKFEIFENTLVKRYYNSENYYEEELQMEELC